MFGGRGGGRGGVNSKVRGPSSSSRTMFLKKKDARVKPKGGDSVQSSPESSSSVSPSVQLTTPAASPKGSPRTSPAVSPRSEGKSEQEPQAQGAQVPEITVAYFLFERESGGVTHLAFCNNDTVFVIDKDQVQKEGKVSISSLVKGAPFKVTPSSTPSSPVSIFRNFQHVSIESFSSLQSQDFKSIPEVLCKVSSSGNERLSYTSRNFQFMPDSIKAFNIQIPDAAVPEALIREGSIWAKIRFLPKVVYRRNGSLVKYPSVVKGSFRICDQHGEEIPRALPNRTFSSDTIAALKRSLGVNLIVGGSPVLFSDSGCLVVSDWTIEDFGVNNSTSIEELLNAVSVQARASDHQNGYFKAHFGKLSSKLLAQSGSQPTILFIPGFSDAFSFRMAEALAVRAVKAGCRALILASSSIASTDANFSGNPRPGPYLSLARTD